MANISKELERQLATRDRETASPSERAQRIYGLLLEREDISNWDCTCFAAEYLGLMSAALPWIAKEAKSILKFIYTQHYLLEDERNKSERTREAEKREAIQKLDSKLKGTLEMLDASGGNGTPDIPRHEKDGAAGEDNPRPKLESREKHPLKESDEGTKSSDESS